jgi:hypothetical protein
MHGNVGNIWQLMRLSQPFLIFSKQPSFRLLESGQPSFLLLESDQAAELLPLIFSNSRANPHQTVSESSPKQPSRGARTEGMQEARGVTQVLSRNHCLGKGS